MAKIKTSALVADIKGKVGGNVFASNKGGNYVRRNKKPTDLKSPKQQAIRLIFATVTMNWRMLTEQQRNSWNEGAVNFPYQDSLGETKIYSGQMLYVKLNNNLLQRGLAMLDTCPLPVSFPSVSGYSILNTLSGNKLSIRVSFDDTRRVPVDYVLSISATAALSAGIGSPQKSRFKQIAVFVANDNTNNESITAAYESVFDSLLLGQTLFVQIMLTSTISGESSIALNIKSTRVA